MFSPPRSLSPLSKLATHAPKRAPLPGLPPSFPVEGDMLHKDTLASFMSCLIRERKTLERGQGFFAEACSSADGVEFSGKHCIYVYLPGVDHENASELDKAWMLLFLLNQMVRRPPPLPPTPLQGGFGSKPVSQPSKSTHYVLCA